MLTYLGCSAVAAFALAIGLALAGAAPAAAAHAAFALGAMPLIFAAMGHFVPVLTRSTGAGPAIHRLPLLVQAVGAAVVGVLAGGIPGWVLHPAIVAGLVATGVLLGWQWGRGRACLGRPHPGLAWYQAALGCLTLALLAVLAGLQWPAGYRALRLAHLHLNTLGFIGLTALGTLQVLMPTVLVQADPQAAVRLRRQLPWALAGVVASALAGLSPWLTPLAVLLVGGVVADTLAAWVKAHGGRRLLGDGAAVALLGAAVGLLATLAAGFVHGFGWLPGRPAVTAFFALFLLPLVTGALSQLLPVWCFPGPATPARARMRAMLVRFGALRTGLFLVGGGLLAAGQVVGAGLLAVGLLIFAERLLRAMSAGR